MPQIPSPETKESLYSDAFHQITAMLDGEDDMIVRMATVSAVLAGVFDYYYWTGFYRMIDGGLVIGPYQGTLGCLRIALDRGVCGAAATQRKTVIVPDTGVFPGHIACDANSLSEIVVPVFDDLGKVAAVLDVDSDQLAAFDDTDQRGLERIIESAFSSS